MERSSVFGAECRGCKRGFLLAHRVGVVERRGPRAIQAPEQQADARVQDSPVSDRRGGRLTRHI